MKTDLIDTVDSIKRSKICHDCEHYIPAKNIIPARCGECGCVLSIKIKFKNQHCPLTPPKW